MPADPIDPNIAMAAGGGGIFGAIGFALYKMVRMMKADRRDDAANSAADTLRKELQEQLKALTERCDRFAEERNRAMMAEARLQERVESLNKRVSDLEAERDTLRDDLRVTKHEATTLRAKVDQLQAALATTI